MTIDRAGRALVDYAAQFSAIVCAEHYVQQMGDQSFSRPFSRTLLSEFALVWSGGEWLGFRDVVAVDGRRIADRQDRLLRLFSKSSDSSIVQARKINDQSARHNLGAMQRNFNVPTMALFFLWPSNASRFRFVDAGAERLEGRLVRKVDYKEVGRPTIVRTSAGKDMPVQGTFWIEPGTGRVWKTRMLLADRTRSTASYGTPSWITTSASITVTYREDAVQGLLVPDTMMERYEGPSVNRFTGTEELSIVSCRASYSGFRRFETSGRVRTVIRLRPPTV